MAKWNPRANDLFLDALDLASAADRQSFLDQACAGDETLRQAVESMLQAHTAAGSLLEQPVLGGNSTTVSPGAPRADVAVDVPGSRIGPYKLLQKIGEGGMGVVWMAEQHEPVKRQVALKVIRPGMNTSLIIARFEAERQALALMDHPHIARIFDAGQVSETDVRPFFVMELVKGIPITRYCDEHRLDARQRLELMVPVCQAIQHAHQKGIIHRDIKPSNVLVANYDGKPVPKVIDFGISKATGQQLTERTLFTGFGSILGTLEYMSPEQAEFNALDIDTRTDIYSLGVLLYELLTGTTPLTRDRLKQAAIVEVLRLIREEEPPTPSTRLSQSHSSAEPALRQRQLEAAKAVRGELDWIVMKALDKDRNRRYESAASLALDLGRFLRDEPVQAGPPSRSYRLGKFVKRNKGAVTAAALVLLSMILGIIGTGLALVEARQQRDDAQLARKQEAKQRQDAFLERDRANQEKTKADQAKKLADKLRLHAEDQKNAANALRIRAEGAEGDARKHLAETHEALFTGQVARAANLWQSDPLQAQLLLRDYAACPPPARDFAWHFYHRLCQTQRTLFRSAGGGQQKCLAISPDGKLLASGCVGGTVHIWELGSGILRHHLKAHENAVEAMVFSGDGKTLFTGGADTHILRWDVVSGKQIGTPLAMSGMVHGLALHPDGKRLAAGSHQLDDKAANPDNRLIAGEVVLWNIDTGERTELLRGNPAGVLQVAISTDGKLVAAGTTHDFSVRIWEIETGKEYAAFQGDNVGWVQGLAFSHDNRRLAFASADFQIRLWDIAKKMQLRSFAGHVHELWGIAFSRSDKLLVSSSWDKTVRVWDVDSPWRDSVKERLILRDCEAFPIAFTPDDRGLIVQQGYNLVHHALPIQEEYQSFEQQDAVRDLAFSPDGQFLASISKDRSARLWNTQTCTGAEIGVFPEIPRGIVFSPDSRTVFVGTTLTAGGKTTGQIVRWDVQGGKTLEPWLVHGSPITALAVSRNQQLLASGSDEVVKLWDLQSGKEIAHVALPRAGKLQALAFHPSEKLLAGAPEFTQGIIWDLANGKFEERRRFTRPSDSRTPAPPMGGEERPQPNPASALIFTSSGRLVFNSGDAVWVLDLAKEWPTKGLEITKGTLVAVAVSPDERTAAIGLEDRTIQLWDLASKRLRATLTRHAREISALAFSADGTILASGDQNRTYLAGVRGGTIKLWNASPPLPIGHNTLPHALAFSQDGSKLLSSAEDSLILWDTERSQEATVLIDKWRGAPVLSANADRLVAAHQDGTLRLLDARTGAVLARENAPAGLVSLFPCADGQIAGAGFFDAMYFWDAATLKPMKSRPAKASRQALTMAANGRWIAGLAWEDAMAHFWVRDLDTQVDRVLATDRQMASGHFTPLGNDRLITVHADGLVKIWEVHTGKLVLALKEPVTSTWSWRCAVSADAQTLVAADLRRGGPQGWQWEIRFWKLADGTEWRAPVHLAPSRLIALAATADNRLHAATDAGTAVKCWPSVRYR